MKIKRKKLKAFIAECVQKMPMESLAGASISAFIGEISGYPVRIEILTAVEALEEHEHNVNDKLPKKLDIISD